MKTRLCSDFMWILTTAVVGRNIAPQKTATSNFWNLWILPCVAKHLTKLRSLRGRDFSGLSGWALKAIMCVLTREGQREFGEMHRREGNLEMEEKVASGIGITTGGGSKEWNLPRASRRSKIFTLDSGLQKHKSIHSCCFMPQFVVICENSHRKPI